MPNSRLLPPMPPVWVELGLGVGVELRLGGGVKIRQSGSSFKQ